MCQVSTQLCKTLLSLQACVGVRVKIIAAGPDEAGPGQDCAAGQDSAADGC